MGGGGGGGGGGRMADLQGVDSTVLSSWGGKLGESGSALGLGPGWQCWF